MTPDWTRLQKSIKSAFPGSSLTAMADAELGQLRRRHPHLPAHYFEFLRNVGWGSIGEMGFMFYQGPMEPSEIYDVMTAGDLKGVLFIGDNFGGWCLGLDQNGNLVSFDGLSSSPEKEQERTVHEFLTAWMKRVGSA
jgi:hypothetical protein